MGHLAQQEHSCASLPYPPCQVELQLCCISCAPVRHLAWQYPSRSRTAHTTSIAAGKATSTAKLMISQTATICSQLWSPLLSDHMANKQESSGSFKRHGSMPFCTAQQAPWTLTAHALRLEFHCTSVCSQNSSICVHLMLAVSFSTSLTTQRRHQS